MFLEKKVWDESQSAKEDEEVKVDNTGLGAEATRGVVEGANMGNKQ